MQPSRNKPPAAPGTGHRDGCRCGACDRWRKAAIEAARLREFNLQKARLAKVGAVEGRKEAKREAAHDALARDVQLTERRASEYARAAASVDPRMEVFLALRRAGKTFAEADAGVTRQFGPEPTTGGESDEE